MTFHEMEAQYARLRERLDAGELDQARFRAAVQALTVRDPEGRYWGMAPGSGQWHVWEDGAWKKAEPPKPRGGADATSCSWCGHPVQAGASYCGHCGQPLTALGSDAAQQSARPTPPPSLQRTPGPPPVQSPPPPPAAPRKGIEAQEPGAAPAPPPTKGRRAVPVVLLVGAGLVLCLLAAAGGGFIFWRGQTGDSLFPQASAPTASPVPTRAEAASTPELAAETATPTAGELEPLVGVWESTEEGPLLQFSLTTQPDGRVRLLPLFMCQVKEDFQERMYLELETTGEGTWEGFMLVEEYCPWEDETEEWEREPIQVSLSADSDRMAWTSPEEDASITWQRADSAETVVLEIVNAMNDDVDVWELRMIDSNDPNRLDGEIDRLSSILFVGDSCQMTLPPGTYDLTALDENDEVVASREGMATGRNPAWVITGGD